MNFYGWVRESVKRAVLLGFSDAVEQVGVPEGDNQDISRHLLAVLRDGKSLETRGGMQVLEDQSTGGSSNRRRNRRKLDSVAGNEEPLGRRRLGRSLADASTESDSATAVADPPSEGDQTEDETT